MNGKKDLLIQDGILEEEMYKQMIIMRKQITAIKQILEVCNEKNIADDSNNGADRM